jgi:hypothetical protein
MSATAENPICASCGVEYVPDYEGPCQEPGCTGRVSWRATADHLAARLAEVMQALRDQEAECASFYAAAAQNQRELDRIKS